MTGGLSGHPWVRLVHRDEHINDPAFADAAVEHLVELLVLNQPGCRLFR